MLERLALALPLARVDAWFVRGLTWLSPKVTGRADCLSCSQTFACGTCGCSQGPNCGSLQCDACPAFYGQPCGCYCPPPPIC